MSDVCVRLTGRRMSDICVRLTGRHRSDICVRLTGRRRSDVCVCLTGRRRRLGTCSYYFSVISSALYDNLSGKDRMCLFYSHLIFLFYFQMLQAKLYIFRQDAVVLEPREDDGAV